MQKQLIHIDQIGLQSEKNRVKIAIDNLNQLKIGIEDLIGKLSNEQMEKIPKIGIKILKSELKKMFPFPNADEEFNYKAIGLNPTSIERFYNQKRITWLDVKFIIHNNEFIADENQPRYECYYHYADSEKKIHVKETLEKYIEVVNDIHELNLFFPGAKNDVRRSIKHYVLSENNGKLVLNNEKLPQLLNTLK